MVSPASSVASSVDIDDKSVGSDTFDCLRNSKPTKLSLDKEKAAIKSEGPNFTILEKYMRSEKDGLYGSKPKPMPTATTPTPLSANTSREPPPIEPNPNMVECTICARRFKNIPALNGHMRLHGGYYRKDNDKKQEVKTFQSEPMSNHTVSSNVKTLIEEKIIQKRKLEPVQIRQPPVVIVSSTTTPSGSGCNSSSSSNSGSGSTSSEVRFQNLSVPCSTQQQPLCSTSDEEPPSKRMDTSVSTIDNLVFPVLPQPDTSKLLANLQTKHSQIAGFLPVQPLPNVPLPTSKCFNPVKSNDTHVKPAHIHNLLKVDKKHKTPRFGDEYQATIPRLEARRLTDDSKYGVVSRDTLMWSQEASGANCSDAQIEVYLKFCASAAVSVNMSDEEALQILNRNFGDVFKATQEVLSLPWTRIESSTTSWTSEQVDMFYEALCKHKKNFIKISSDIPGKSSRECVEFYYAWKNLCREESQSFKPIISATDELGSNFSL